MRLKVTLLIGLMNIGFLIGTAHAATQQKQTWDQFIAGVKQEAAEQGIRPSVIEAAFKNVKAPSRKVLHYDRTQPEHRLTYLKYRNTRADAYRIKLGQREMKKYSKLLNKIGDEYGVSPCFIVSLWGLETSYGRFMGKFPVIQSLSTLAYDNRRAAFFRKQLMYALHILDEEHVALEDFKGEWAGATGQPQFLPSSFHKFAVDYNGDGKKDIWKTQSDIFASIANYLHANGWKADEPWMVEVEVPAHFDESIMTRKVVKTVDQWKAMGVHIIGTAPGITGNLKASIVEPYGGPTMMIFNNFKVIMLWNRSTYYAGTVGYMAEKICKRKL